MCEQYKLALATDLDGTFLEGDHRSKNFFYNELLRLREEVLLVYVTGRPIHTVKQFCQRGYLPSPHFIIGDHGTHIVDGVLFEPVEPLQNPISERWNNSNKTLKELLCDDPGIRLQPIDPPYRVAYYYDPDLLQRQTLQKITDTGFDFVQSCDMYLDVLPRGVNKGSSLLKLLDHLSVQHDIVMTAGDSLNDLSLFQTGLKSVAVANSEPGLWIATQKLNNVYRSGYPGILGVIDGLRFYDKFQSFQDFQQ